MTPPDRLDLTALRRAIIVSLEAVPRFLADARRLLAALERRNG